MNRYLEKVAELEKEALNALKARAMAHEAGVVVDPDTQWKWALRQFRRGPEGKVAQGRDRAQVLNRLMGNPAAGNNNLIQNLSSAQRKLNNRDEILLDRSRNIRHRGHIGSDMYTERADGSVSLVSSSDYLPPVGQYSRLDSLQKKTPVSRFGMPAPKAEYISTVTIPSYVTPGANSNHVLRESAYSPSGIPEVDSRHVYESVVLNRKGLETSVHTHVHPTGNRYLSKSIGGAIDGEQNRVSYLDSVFRSKGGEHRVASPSGAILRKKDWKTKKKTNHLFGSADLGAYSQEGLLNNPAMILTGDRGRGNAYLGLHRVASAGTFHGSPIDPKFRQAYLDLTPRKARAENPYLDKLHEMGKTL